jgi:hypothetical protein
MLRLGALGASDWGVVALVSGMVLLIAVLQIAQWRRHRRELRELREWRERRARGSSGVAAFDEHGHTWGRAA